ncbi:MAG: hypothetical protein LBR13_06710 [Dysgonamonadaceae bacterium]|jgi:hypothetical protein|nr:hypothetical protein [Dysgonamonadaceae bacterium]
MADIVLKKGDLVRLKNDDISREMTVVEFIQSYDIDKKTNIYSGKVKCSWLEWDDKNLLIEGVLRNVDDGRPKYEIFNITDLELLQ